MNRVLRTLPILLATLAGSTQLAFAQQGSFQGRGFIVVNGGYQMTTNDFDSSSTFRANAEDGSFSTDYEVKGGPTFDIAGGARVWRQLGVAVGVTRFSHSTPSSLTGSVPHPFFFNRGRAVAGDVAGLKREELGVHVQARAILPVGNRVEVMAFGGPSFFTVKQGMVTTITWNETYPYDDATFGSATTVSADGSKVGFNGGVDVGFFFTRQVGVGGTISFSGATVEVEGTGITQEVKAGGAKFGAGLRLRF